MAAGVSHWPALAVWCSLGFFPGDRTADQRVRLVRPASHARIRPPDRSVSSERYWWVDPHPDHRCSMAATVTALDDVLAEVLGEQADGTTLWRCPSPAGSTRGRPSWC